MVNLIRKAAVALIAAAGFFASQNVALAQGQMDPKEQEKKMDEFIQKQVEKYETLLKLEDWQVFYVDSILNHDYRAMQEEMNALSSSKVSNSDLYQKASDKWSEKIYNAFHSIFTEDQWAKYLKQGAGREAKNREKRKEKIEGK